MSTERTVLTAAEAWWRGRIDSGELERAVGAWVHGRDVKRCQTCGHTAETVCFCACHGRREKTA
jgi:hypothetical protein